MIPEEILNRKGAIKSQNIPTEIINLLNKGQIETVNLIEWLSIDQVMLIKNTFPSIGLQSTISTIIKEIQPQKKPSTMRSIKLIGQYLYSFCIENNNLSSTIDNLSKHPSDTIRCYATYLIALNENLSISGKLNHSQKLIADHHFGVREIVWMALRPSVENQIMESLDILKIWTNDSDENIRRFTTEVIRPRGVWCKHLDILKTNPEIAMPILENLMNDPSKYVQNSVGNWLNDASKSKADFIITFCEKWNKKSASKETKYILKRALRTINKQS